MRRRGAAAFRFVLFQERLEPGDDLGVVGVEVVALGGVGRQVVEFGGLGVGLVVALLLEPVGFFVVVAGGAVDQDPVGLADGEGALSAVVDGGFADGVVECLAEQGGENV